MGGGRESLSIKYYSHGVSPPKSEKNSAQRSKILPYPGWGSGVILLTPSTSHGPSLLGRADRVASPVHQGIPGWCDRGKHPSRAIPGLPPGPLSHQTLREDAHSWEIIPPAILLSGYPPRWPHQSKSINIFDLPYITIILLAHSKRVVTKKCEIKYEKNITPCGTSTAVDPAKRDVERTRIELAMLNFCPGPERALPAHSGRPIAFPFWEHGPPGPPTRFTIRFAIAGYAGEWRPGPHRCVLC
jgi:putative transposon-encoded protein